VTDQSPFSREQQGAAGKLRKAESSMNLQLARASSNGRDVRVETGRLGNPTEGYVEWPAEMLQPIDTDAIIAEALNTHTEEALRAAVLAQSLGLESMCAVEDKRKSGALVPDWRVSIRVTLLPR
jgi:hypothetical protein